MLPSRTTLIIALTTLGLLTAIACGPARGDGGGSGGGESAGDPCSQQDADEGAQICSGTRALECKAGDGELAWEVDEDCAESGARCVSGECLEVEDDNNTVNNVDNGSCPDVSGTWIFEDHCEASLIGLPYEVTQDGCQLTVSTPGWGGSIDAQGVVTLSGPTDGATLTCVGQAEDGRLESSCAPPCDVVLVRE